MANDYYDFNPTATTWVVMLSVMVLFVLLLSVALIYFVERGQSSAPATEPATEPRVDALVGSAGTGVPQVAAPAP